MSRFDNPSLLNSYQFPRWSTTINRPHTSLPAKNANDMFQLGIDHRNKIERSSKKSILQQNKHILTESGILSPPLLNQPTSTPDCCSTTDQLSIDSFLSPSYQITPIRIQSATLTIPIKKNSNQILLKNFPKQSHEKRKITQERKRRKQQIEKYSQIDSDNNWFQLRQSLQELKRLATTEDILIDPMTSFFNCDGYSFQTLKQTTNQQSEQIKINKFKSESGTSSSMDFMRSSNVLSRTSLLTSQSFLPRSRMIKQSAETYPRRFFEPLIVSSKPIHPLILTNNTDSSKTKNKQRRITSCVRSPSQKRTQLLISDLSNNDDPTISSTSSPNLQDVKEEEEEKINSSRPIISRSSNRSKTSNISLKSTIKLKSQVPRSRSALDPKYSHLLNKNYPRFILITDQEHRVESWYHQYPFILSDDLIQSFQTNKSTILAYFIDDYQQNITTKTYLQGKPFHINNDWNKYDLIFISNNIYQQIIIHLQTIIKSLNKIIHIYQINHQEDLKTQIKYICKQLNQKILSNI